MENQNLVQGSVKKAMSAAGASSRDLWQVDPRKLRPIPGFNVRVRDDAYAAHIRNIANSIKTEGFYQDRPLSGYVAVEDGEQVIYFYDGHSRHEAVMLAIEEGAEIPRVPVVITAAGTSVEDLTVALVKMNSGKPLTAYETGIVCKRLSRYGWTVAEIATRLDLSEPYVDGLLLLASAPRDIQAMVQDGRLSASQAIETLRSEGSNAVAVLDQAQQRASAEGKTRITRRHLPGALFKKVVRKNAERMADTISSIKSDHGYSRLSPETQEQIQSLIELLEGARSLDAQVEEPEQPSEAPSSDPSANQ
jgi:ParB-like chromosome segregation protein Spo0J